MAYSRFRRRRVRRRRNPIRRRTITRTRRVRTRRPRRTLMSRRRIVDVASVKKYDNMMPWTSATYTTPSYSAGPITWPRNTAFNSYHNMVFSPTARDRTPADVTSDPNSESRRTATATFAKGYKETITLTSSNGVPWRWRRIVFWFKGDEFRVTGADQFYYETTVLGMTRLQIPTNPVNEAALTTLIFQGFAGRDFVGPFDANIDTNRIRVVSDKTRTVNPGSTSGGVRVMKEYYPLNRSIYYDDDETGNTKTDSYWSSMSNKSAGDLYIVDYFSSGGVPEQTGSTTQLAVQCEGKYYWHER